MLIEIFALLLFTGLVLVIIGYAANTDVLKLLGYLFLFLLGFVLGGIGSSGIMYHSGDNVSTTGSLTIVTPNYSFYNNNTMGFYTIIVSIFGFISVFLERKNTSYGAEDD